MRLVSILAIRTARLLLCALPLLLAGLVCSAAPNLLFNADFENPTATAWEKRTPDDSARSLAITADAAHSGKFGARIVNTKETVSRWRQTIKPAQPLAPGAQLRLAGWIRAQLQPGGYASLRLYFMDQAGKILAQPQTRGVTGKTDWARAQLNAAAPAGTDHLMVYLELQNALGQADYDDLTLTQTGEPETIPVLNDLLLLTDADAQDPAVETLRTLYPNRLVVAPPDTAPAPEKFRGAIVLARKPATPFDFKALEKFAGQGNPVVVDLSVYARWRALQVTEIKTTNQPTMLIRREHPATKGFQPGDTLPWGARSGKAHWNQRVLAQPGPGQPLAESSSGGVLVLAETVGAGTVLATDLCGLPEPAYNVPGALNKYLFAGNLLGQTVRFGRHYQARLPYADLVAAMRQLAKDLPALQFAEEGPAHGDYKICSLSLGDPQKPAFLVYGAMHGSEWEPAYGLLTLARYLAANPDQRLFDLQRFRLKIVPTFNPSGYDLFTRQSAAKVDLNRNGGEWWAEFKGRDSNQDGQWGPGDYDWKGSGPFSEPETQTLRKLVEQLKPFATLEFHGNTGGRGNNRLVVLPLTALEGNEERAQAAVRQFNRAIRNRYALLESDRPAVQQYEIETVQWDGHRPTLIQTACKGAYGFLCEVPAGYRGTYGLVMQTDLVIETAAAFFQAYQTP